MASKEGKYNIKAISNLVGIQPGTLRAWERRYQILSPVRNESGHRLYTEQDLKVLKWLVEKVDQGFTISQAVALLESETTGIQGDIKEDNADSPKKIRDELLRLLLTFQEGKAQELMNQAFSLYSVEKVVIDILGSLLVTIGDLWEKGKITTAHEHYTSQLLRTRISIIMHSLPSNELLPKAIAVCGPNEHHEGGLLIFTLFLRRKGFEVIYLGTSIAEGDIQLIVEEVNPGFLFMSCSMRENVEKTVKIAQHVAQLHPSVKIGLGGAAFSYVPAKEKEAMEPFLLGDTKEKWNEWLNSKLAELENG
ncbi:MerR family transcriptional regulator [Bacillus songklensis]|uniref:MerR family transcriptional regulator n=1 Tax=Bacillus songklensis TaxID=1069116 RepID=A0ABV8B0Q0_9BACI